jgi:hypothetical protein
MTLAFNENAPILVAPRPVRIASEPGVGYSRRCNTPLRLVSTVADQLERVKISGDMDFEERNDSASPEKELGSPRSSPRSSLPSEALEEFLSILKPSSFFPPSSPILRARRNTGSLPCFPIPYRARVLHSRGDSITLVEEADRSQSYTPMKSPEFLFARDEISSDHERYSSDSSRWYGSGALSSPINRLHTRNPFQRQTYETSVILSTPSPASVPLPSPTPEERAIVC